MAVQWVRLGMAVAIIVPISIGLYQLSGRAGAVEPNLAGIAFRRQVMTRDDGQNDQAVIRTVTPITALTMAASA